MTNIVVTSKLNHYTSKQTVSKDIALKEPSVVALDLKQEDILSIEYVGNQLIITLKNGEKITIDPVNVVNGQLDTDIVLITDGGQFDHALLKANEDGGWNFDKYIRLNTIDPLLQYESSGLGLGAWLATGAGIIGAGVALSKSSGSDGSNGSNGTDGAKGNSAFDLAVDKGYKGTVEEWLASLVGKDGVNGINGSNGVDGKTAYDLAVDKGYTGTAEEWLQSLVGKNGINGIDGVEGLNAYEIAVKNGFVGSEQLWLLSLVGKDGTNGTDGATGLSAYDLAIQDGFKGTLTEWLQSLHGQDGKSAYDLAVDGGFVGTETEWLETLKGADGKTAYELAVDKGYEGSEQEWIESLKGQDGANGTKGESAYDIAVRLGFEGTEADWLESLKSVAKILETPLVSYNDEDALSGTAIPNVTVHIIDSEGNVHTAISDASGKWSIQPNPLEFKEVGYIYSRNDKNEQSISGVVVGKDTIAPTLTISENNLNLIEGTTNKFHEVKLEAMVNGSLVVIKVTADANGHWSVPNSSFNGLSLVNTPIKVTSQDLAGNKTEQTVLSSGVSIEKIEKNGSDFTATGFGAKNSTIEFTLKDGSKLEVTTDNDGKWTTTTQKNLFAENQIDYDFVVKSDGFDAQGKITQTVDYPIAPVISENTTFALVGTTTPNAIVRLVDSDNVEHKTVADVNGIFRFEPSPLTPTEIGHITAENPNTGLVSSDVTVTAPNYTAPDAPTILTNTESELAGSAQVGTKVVILTKDGVFHEVTVDPQGKWSFEPSPVPSYEIADIYATHLISNLDSTKNTVVGADNTPPPLEILLNNVNVISGTSEPNATIKLKLGNSEFANIKADANGKWSFAHSNLKLIDTDITVISTDVSNNSTEKHVVSSGIAVSNKSPTTLFGVGAKDSTFIITASNGEQYTVHTNAKGEWQQTFTANPYSFTKVTFEYIEKPDGFTSTTNETYWVSYPYTPNVSTITVDTISGTGRVGTIVVLVDSKGNKYETTVDSNGSWIFSHNPLGENEPANIYSIDINTQLPSQKGNFNNIDAVPPFITVLENNLSEVSGTSEPNAKINLYKDGSTSPFASVVADADGNWKFASSDVKKYLTEIGGGFKVVAQDSWKNLSDEVPLITSGIKVVQHNVGIMEFNVIPNSTIIVSDGKITTEYTADNTGLIKIVPNDFSYRNVSVVYKDKADHFSDTVVGVTANHTTENVMYATSSSEPNKIEFAVFADLSNDVRVYDSKGNLIYSQVISLGGGVTSPLVVTGETFLQMGNWIDSNGKFTKNLTSISLDKNLLVDGEKYTISSGIVDNKKTEFIFSKTEADANEVNSLLKGHTVLNHFSASKNFIEDGSIKVLANGVVTSDTVIDKSKSNKDFSLSESQINIKDNVRIVNVVKDTGIEKVIYDSNAVSQFKIQGWDGDYIWGYLPEGVSDVLDIHLAFNHNHYSGSQLPIKIENGFFAIELPKSLDGKLMLNVGSVSLMVGGNIVNTIKLNNVNALQFANEEVLNKKVDSDLGLSPSQYHDVALKGENVSTLNLSFENIRNISQTELSFKTFYKQTNVDIESSGNYIQIRDAHTLQVINEDSIRMHSETIKHDMKAGGDYLFYLYDGAGNANAPLYIHINDDWTYYVSNKPSDEYEGSTQNYIFDLLKYSDELGGHKFKQINDADTKDTNIDVKGLIEIDYDRGTEDIHDFLKAVLSEDGKNTIISVDRDGLDSKYESHELFVLNNVQSTLDELLQNGTIIF